MKTLRTAKTQEKYNDYQKRLTDVSECSLCTKLALKEFNYWKIVKNEFPYDLISETHEMIIPIRHIRESEISADELSELRLIKGNYVADNYDFIVESSQKTSSIKGHFHLHLITLL